MGEFFKYEWRVFKRALQDTFTTHRFTQAAVWIGVTAVTLVVCFVLASKYPQRVNVVDEINSYVLVAIVGVVVFIFQFTFNLVLASVRIDREQREKLAEFEVARQAPKLKIQFDSTRHCGTISQKGPVQYFRIGVTIIGSDILTLNNLKVKIAEIITSDGATVWEHRNRHLCTRESTPENPIVTTKLHSGEEVEFSLVTMCGKGAGFTIASDVTIVRKTMAAYMIVETGSPKTVKDWSYLKEGRYRVKLQAFADAALPGAAEFEFWTSDNGNEFHAVSAS